MSRTRGRAATALTAAASVSGAAVLAAAAVLGAPGPARAAWEIQSGSAGGTPSLSAAESFGFDNEAQLDSEAVYALAPGARQLMVLPEGRDEYQALLDADLAVLTGTGGHPSASIVSDSWQILTDRAVPDIAALVADAQQGQKSPFGFINPLIYRLAGTRALRDILPLAASLPRPDLDAYHGPATSASVDVFDSQERACTEQVTARGYDTMTGVGTPNGSAFIAALRQAAR